MAQRAASGITADGKQLCVLAGTYTSNLTLTADNVWALKGGVFVGGDNTNSAEIRIEPGTKIIGFSGADFLSISRGSKIFAEGTFNNPIVFTAGKDSGRTRGLWGGLVINGNAPLNSCRPAAGVCQGEGEGGSGYYGGNNPHDDIGVLRYVRIEWAGYQITPENEMNGLALQGVGDKTVIDYLQLHMNADDGIEMFGGSVNLKHVVSTGNGDDSLDWTSGWNGKAQYILIRQADDEGNHGFEADNSEKFHDAESRSLPQFSNVTLMGTSQGAAAGGNGVLFRRGTGVHFMNSIITGFKKPCVNIDDAATFAQANAGNVTMTDTIVYCPSSGSFASKTSSEPWEIAEWFNRQDGNKVIDPMLNGYVPMASSPALDAGMTPEDPFFDEVDFLGAVKSSAKDWTLFWTTSARD